MVLPFEWWMDKDSYERLNDYVMAVIYSPLLLVTAALETRVAYRVRFNRSRGETDEDTIEEWEQMDGECDFEGDGWVKKCEETKPNVESDGTLVQIKELRKEIEELKEMLRSLKG